MTNAKTPLKQAPEHVKLAVDLIMMLEQHQLPPDMVLKALALVKQDYIAKQRQQQQSGCD
ncbi:YbaM family protein [Rheinheimera sp. FR7-31]|uniref:YbaM family protein n=1 Tax=Rheinheimera fenheensis TaxID=3152295 RepID=UPI00325E8922